MRFQRISFWLMVFLSFGTGVLDAATYIGMGGIFGANMTGNVILVAISLAGTGNIHITGPLLALGGFVLGSWVAGLVTRRHPASKESDPTIAPLFWITALGMVGISVAFWMLPSSALLFHASTGIIGVLMACQALAARRVGVPDISTVVVTSTLSLLFSEAGRFNGGAGNAATGRRFAAVVSMFGGAVLGAFLVPHGLNIALLVPTFLLVAVAVGYTIVRRTHSRHAETAKPNRRSVLVD
ncbi:YoaK family protein [Paeniglutamicibacter sp. NPDC012692]|uniref:YoaK family protein n=1 Tax=Paeniglutamicibacter sp. NPDC012692 TaxID=3364388 RepID=UPI0036B16E2D